MKTSSWNRLTSCPIARQEHTTHTDTYIGAHTLTQRHTSTHRRTHTHRHTRTHTDTHIGTHTSTHRHRHTHRRTHKHTQAHTHTHTHTDTCRPLCFGLFNSCLNTAASMILSKLSQITSLVRENSLIWEWKRRPLQRSARSPWARPRRPSACVLGRSVPGPLHTATAAPLQVPRHLSPPGPEPSSVPVPTFQNGLLSDIHMAPSGHRSVFHDFPDNPI